MLQSVVELGTMRQEASDQEWLEALSPRWQLPELCKWSWIWNTPTPPCLPGRSETDCCWSKCVTMTACQVSAPSTGIGLCMCMCISVCHPERYWVGLLCLSGSSETKSSLSLAKLVSFQFPLLFSYQFIPLPNVSWHWPLPLCHQHHLLLWEQPVPLSPPTPSVGFSESESASNTRKVCNVTVCVFMSV